MLSFAVAVFVYFKHLKPNRWLQQKPRAAKVIDTLSGCSFGVYLMHKILMRYLQGILPEELLGRIEAVGNAAGSGARMLACDRELLEFARDLTRKVEFLELASLPEFSRAFAKAMNFRER